MLCFKHICKENNQIHAMNENSGMIASGIKVNSCDHSANPNIQQHLLDGVVDEKPREV